MADHGTHFYYGEDAAFFAENYSIFSRPPINWGVVVVNYVLCDF